jgi:hypothetical protein
MFQAAEKHMEIARKLIKTARALKGISMTAMYSYLKRAEHQLVMVELYIK